METGKKRRMKKTSITKRGNRKENVSWIATKLHVPNWFDDGVHQMTTPHTRQSPMTVCE